MTDTRVAELASALERLTKAEERAGHASDAITVIVGRDHQRLADLDRRITELESKP
jgi:hypothetical protein